MSTLHLASTALSALAAACFLLVTFGTEALGPVALTPLGLLFFVVACATAAHHHPHAA